MRLFTSAVLLLLCAGVNSDVLANGGPVDFSNTLGSGNIIYSQYRGLELISENLLVTPGIEYVDVVASYTLVDTGDGSQTEYAFPVDLILSEFNESDDGITIDDEVPVFNITLNGTQLDYQIRQGFNTDVFLNSYGDELDIHRLYFVTSFEISPHDTVELVVSYSFRAWYTDWWFSKGFFTQFQDRSFQYVLDPAGRWGDGTVGQMNIEFDFSEIIANGGHPIILPPGGDWADSRYVISESDFDMASALPLEVSYTVSDWGKSNELLELSEGPQQCTVTASSYLPSNGNSTFSPDNLIDRDLSTAWSENAPGYSGEWIELHLDQPMSVAFVGIVSGYTKSYSTYIENARPRTVTLEIYEEDGVYTETIVLEDLSWKEIETGTIYTQVLPLFSSGMGIETDRVRLRFDDAYPGDTYEDLCISELFVAGWRWE